MDVPRPASWQLMAVKLAHTTVWAFFAGCILAIPLASLLGEHRWAAVFSAIVLLECAILAFNRGRCPLTDLAARYTHRREDNFDIYLPLWLARHNKTIFGTLYLGSVVFAFWQWGRS
jgi:hypothetical protein